MSKITVTSKSGKVIDLEYTKYGIKASCGPISFGAVRTDAGFTSWGLVREAGNRRIDVILEGDELAKAHALFAQQDADAQAMIASDREYERSYNRIINAD